MNPRLLVILSQIAVLLWLANSAVVATAAEPWSRFRGPNGTGQSDATTVPAAWTDADYRWKVELPGVGYSSPVVWGEQILVTSGNEEDAGRVLQCRNTSDGQLVWKRSFQSTTYKKHEFNAYAAATPAVDEDHVYMAWSTPEKFTLLAVDRSSGKTVWQRDLGAFTARHGSGASPMVFENLVIMAIDQADRGAVVAVDRTTGKTRWKTETPVTVGGYATPCIYRSDPAKPQLILSASGYGVIGLDPRTGKQLWDLEVFDDRVVHSPVLAAGLIVVSSGVGGRGTRTVAVRPGNPATGAKPEIAYEVKGSLPYVCTPVVRDDLLFLWYDLGVVTCLDAATGKIHWRERVEGNYFSSPIRIADRLYCTTRLGEMVVLPADKQYKPPTRIPLGARSNSTPAVADGVMYLQTISHLMSLGGE